MKKLVAIEPANSVDRFLHVSWFLHNKCNYNCSYCVPTNKDGSFLPVDYEQAINFASQLFEHYRDKSLIHFSFTGGEPTLWPHFHDFCKYLHTNNCKIIGLTTNGSRSPEYWEKIAKYFGWICFSVHPEFVDIEKARQTIKTIFKQTALTVRLMMHPDPILWEKNLNFGKEIENDQSYDWIRVEYIPLQKILGDTQGEMMSYSDEQQKFLESNCTFERLIPGKKPASFNEDIARWGFRSIFEDGTSEILHSNKLIVNNENHFTGWKCYSGTDLLFIDHLQNIYRASCHQDGIIGNIRDNAFRFPGQPTICTFKSCACEADIQTRKKRPY